ncbi:MAG: hypothetical protein K2G37_01295, partial [Clostridia bacterium]|nr:hypothetical protein [Clostridia bacterium]
YVEAEIAVDATLNIVDAHAIAQRVHDVIEATFEEVRHIVIHVNPYGVRSADEERTADEERAADNENLQN